MPGLVDVFQKAETKLCVAMVFLKTIDRMMVERLADVSEQEFNRAKMLALMTRNQNAMNLVNFT